jgi:hypothetical protein
MAPKVEHVVIDARTNEMCCGNCQEKEKVTLPIPVIDFVKKSKAFTARHKDCASVNLKCTECGNTQPYAGEHVACKVCGAPMPSRTDAQAVSPVRQVQGCRLFIPHECAG